MARRALIEEIGGTPLSPKIIFMACVSELSLARAGAMRVDVGDVGSDSRIGKNSRAWRARHAIGRRRYDVAGVGVGRKARKHDIRTRPCAPLHVLQTRARGCRGAPPPEGSGRPPRSPAPPANCCSA